MANKAETKPDVRVTLRLPADLYDVLIKLAKRDDRSLNSEIVHLLRGANEAAWLASFAESKGKIAKQ